MQFRFRTSFTTTPRAAAMPPIRFAGIVGCIAFAVATLLYAIGMSFWSGQRVAELDVRAGGAFELGGLTVRTADATARQVGPVPLDPAMNPVRLVLHSTYGRVRTGQSVWTTVTMRGADGRARWTESKRIFCPAKGRSGAIEGSSSSVLNTFDVQRAGDYTFELSLRAPAGDPLHRVRLEVRRGVADANSAIVWIGAAASLASLLVGLIGGLARREGDSERLAA